MGSAMLAQNKVLLIPEEFEDVALTVHVTVACWHVNPRNKSEALVSLYVVMFEPHTKTRHFVYGISIWFRIYYIFGATNEWCI